jgi:hypothetical protein
MKPIEQTNHLKELENTGNALVQVVEAGNCIEINKE